MMEPATGEPDIEITDRLGIDRKGASRRRLRRWLLWFGLTVVAVGIGAALIRMRGQEAVVRYQMEEVRRGNLTITVEATGELEPITQVNVGTEISGIIQTVAWTSMTR